MAKTKKKKYGKKKNVDRKTIVREIAGIMVILFGLISAISVLYGHDAIILNRVNHLYSYIFGIGAPLAPMILFAVGAFVMLVNFALLRIIGHVSAIYLLVLVFFHVLESPGKFDYITCISPDLVMSGGGVIAGTLACNVLHMVGKVGSCLLLITIALIYIQFTFRISYIELYKSALPYWRKVWNVFVVTYYKLYKYMAILSKKIRVNTEKQKKINPVKDIKNEISERKVQPSVETVSKQIELQIEEIQAKNFDPEDSEMVVISSEPGGIEQVESKVFKLEEEVEDIEVVEPVLRNWVLPVPEEWLNVDDNVGDAAADESMRRKLEATLKSFKLPASIVNVVRGASFTRLEIELEPGTRVSQLISLGNDIALSLAADSRSIRIEAPIPGKSAVGIEVPNKDRSIVPISRIFLSNALQSSKSNLAFCLGEDIGGNSVVADLVRMPHLLIAGSTNSGKSVCLNALLSSIIGRRHPEEVRFIMIDVKRVELTPFNGIPHLLSPVICETAEASNALRWVTGEMDKRYKIFAEAGVRNIDAYNSVVDSTDGKMHRIVIVVDELADLMMITSSNQYVETYICRITQLARATGIHMILATQRPDTRVITGTIKNNIPCRISFAVASQIDSRTILDQKGAESLLGRGDMLFMPPDSNRLIRLQGAFVSDNELKKLVNLWKNQGKIDYPLKFEAESEDLFDIEGIGQINGDSEDEMLYKKAVEIVITSGQVSISMLQRKLRIGYNRSARLVELMEERNVVGPYDGVKPREVLLTPAAYEKGEF